MVALLVIGVVSSLISAQLAWGQNYPVIATLVLLSLSLVACLALNASKWWKKRKAIFVFHVGLLGLALSGMVSGLTSFHGAFSLAVRQGMLSNFTHTTHGPLYRDRLGQLEIKLLDSQVEMHERDLGVKSSENLIEVKHDSERPTTTVIRYNEPLKIGNYRFYLSGHRGYSLVFWFTDAKGSQRPVVIFLPDYPEVRLAQSYTFRVPNSGAGDIFAGIDLRNKPYRYDRPWSLTGSNREEPVTLAYTSKGERKRNLVRVGESVKLPGGTLKLDSIRPWHGFIVDYDPARPYMGFFTAIAIFGISWHYVARQVTRRTRRPRQEQT